MNRREFIALGFCAATWPHVVAGQPRKANELPIVGFLGLGSEVGTQHFTEAFRSGLESHGYVEGQNIRVYYRFADGEVDRLRALTKELVAMGARMIVTASTTAVKAAHEAAPAVPIVSWASTDPIVMGYAKSLARPGGMVTGVFSPAGTHAKFFELLKEVRPEGRTFGYLMNASNPSNPQNKELIAATARALGIEVTFKELTDQSELPGAFMDMASLGVQGIAIRPDPLLISYNHVTVELARKHLLPSVSDDREFAVKGGLFSLSADYPAMIKRSAWYVDRILKGEFPGDLPAEQAREFRLIINLKTAKDLGLTIPPAIFARADEVIE